MPVQVKVEGADELRALLRRIGSKDLQKALTRAHKTVSGLLVPPARSLVPVRTGNLAASIRAGATQKAAIVRAGGAKAPYAAAIHFGRKRGNVGSPPGNHKGENSIKGVPFLWDAGEQVEPVALGVYEREIADVLRQAAAEVRI